MGKCKYCGQDAGFFHSKHAECEQRHLNGVARIKGILATCFQHKEDFYLHQNEIQTICRDAFVSDDVCRNIYCESFDAAIEQYLDDGIIDQNEEHSVARFMQFTGLPQQVLNANKSLEKVVQSKVLQELYNRKNEMSIFQKRNEQIFSFFASFFLLLFRPLKHQLKADFKPLKQA